MSALVHELVSRADGARPRIGFYPEWMLMEAPLVSGLGTLVLVGVQTIENHCPQFWEQRWRSLVSRAASFLYNKNARSSLCWNVSWPASIDSFLLARDGVNLSCQHIVYCKNCLFLWLLCTKSLKRQFKGTSRLVLLIKNSLSCYRHRWPVASNGDEEDPRR